MPTSPTYAGYGTVRASRSLQSLGTSCLGKVAKHKNHIFAYANNHYARYAPATIDMFCDLCGVMTKHDRYRVSNPTAGWLFE
jgi:hypothetical protein